MHLRPRGDSLRVEREAGVKYSEICQPKRLGVRRDEVNAMVGYGRVVEEWIKDGKLKAANPGDPVPIYSTREVELLFERWMIERRNAPPIRDAECQRQAARDARSAARQS
jgi:hypothetical protein